MDHRAIPKLETAFGFLRIISPSLCVLDRLAAYLHWNDRQCWDQAVLVCRNHPVDWDDMAIWARNEGLDVQVIDRLRAVAGYQP